jgi:tetratricopeptide (TPR) repeat protein
MSVIQPQTQSQQQNISFGIHTTTPPPIDPQVIMQRADEVGTIQRMLVEQRSSAVMLIGNPGAGKSTLAALLYNRLLLAKQSNMPAPRYLVWLTIGSYTTLPDIIAAILNELDMGDPSLFLQSEEEQIASLLQALRRPQDNALVVLDQFEQLLHPETNQGNAGRGNLSLFLDMLQKDLGTSRFLLTNYTFPYDEKKQEQRVRSYLVSRISIPEGIALLQQRGVAGSSEELSLVWQRCTGHVHALVLCSALLRLSGLSLNVLLNSPNYQPLWSGDVTTHLITGVYHSLNPIQYALIRALSLFYEPVPLKGIIMSITGSSSSSDTGSRPYSAFERELHKLVGLDLVQKVTDQSGVLCYTMHASLRQYVLEHYLEGSERRQSDELASLGVHLAQDSVPSGPQALQVAVAAGHMQVAGYYRFLGRERTPSLAQRKGLQDITPLVLAVRHLCLSWHWQEASDLLFRERLYESMVQWGAWNALIGLYTAMLPPLGNISKQDEGLICSHVAMLYGRLQEEEQSRIYFERALGIQRQIGDKRGEASTLANRGELLRIQGEQDEARTCFEQVLALAQSENDIPLQCVMLHNLGLIYHEAKDLKQAFSYYLEALRLGYNLREQRYKGMILTNMGVLLYEEDLQKEALAVLLAALRLRQALNDPTVVLLENFLNALEERIGSSAYAQLCQEAVGIQQQVFARFMNTHVRQ